MHKMRNRGITLLVADRYACKIAGVHPYVIWGDLWWDDVLVTQVSIGDTSDLSLTPIQEVA